MTLTHAANANIKPIISDMCISTLYSFGARLLEPRAGDGFSGTNVFFENRLYELSTNRFKGGIHPEGYKNLKRFTMDPFPRFVYEIEHRRIEKRILLLHDKNILIIRYANKTMGPPAQLVLKPIMAARKISEITKG